MANQGPKDDSRSEELGTSRRDVLKGAAALGVISAGVASAHEAPSSNPYGPRPGGGINLPDYYQPWPAIKNRNTYLPGTEVLPKNEMRISFMGSTPFPVSQEQSGTCMLVELGNGTAQPRRFFFDMGGGSMRNVIAMQVPIALISDLFISHLHVDHYESGGPALDAESVAEVRAHWDGLFQFGGPDVQVINVTKDAIWSQ